MPQFAAANFIPQFAWLVLAFAILYFGIVRATLPKLARTVTAREEKVGGDIQAAADAKAESDRVHDAYEDEMKQAHERAHAAIGEAKAKSIRESEAKLGEVDRDLGKRLDKAFADLEIARARAGVEIEGVAAQAAADIVDRIAGVRPAEADALIAVRTALAA